MAAPVHYILCTLGTRGDIAPFVAVARELVDRGEKVTLLANDNWAGLVQAAGAEFASIAPADPPQDGRDDFLFFLSNVLPSFHQAYARIEAVRSRGCNVVVVYKMGMHGAACAAEKLRLPNVKVALQPSAIRSLHRPAWPLTGLARGRCRFLTRPLVPAVYLLRELANPYRSHVNRFRGSVGLAPMRLGAVPRIEDLTLVFCPRWFALPQPDWPRPNHCLGFPFSPPAPLDHALKDFLSREGSPVVFTPGTGITDTHDFFAGARQVCESLGLPGVFLSASAPPTDNSARILSRAFADLGDLLPRSRLLVHHGGIGTTAQALRAGIPQLILPGRFDQPDNAMRIAALRLGAVCLQRVPDAVLWTSLIRRALGDITLRVRLATAARDISGTPAAANAATLIQQLAADRF